MAQRDCGVCPWRFSKFSWTQSLATGSSLPCFEQGVWTRWSPGALPTSTILQFCDSMNYFIPVTLVISESKQGPFWMWKKTDYISSRSDSHGNLLHLRVELYYGEPIQRIMWLFSFWDPEMLWKFSWWDGFWVPVDSTILEFLTHIQEFRLCSQLCFWTAVSVWTYPFPSLYFIYCFVKWWA